MRKSRMTGSALALLALSTTLPGCAGRAVSAAPPPIVTVVDAPDLRPQGELLTCARRPAGFPAAVIGTMTPEARAAAIRIMTAFGANADQLDRLVVFHGGSCGGDK